VIDYRLLPGEQMTNIDSWSQVGQAETNGQEKLPRTMLSDRVKEYIVEAILSRQLQPGDRIVETLLARRLGVSQAPVREALRELVVMGFVESHPYRGTSVRALSQQDLWESYTVRAALEALAARLAAARLTEADEQHLEAILAEMLEASRLQDHERTIRLDNKFHETILQIAGNKLLSQVWKTLEFGRWTMVTYRLSNYGYDFLAIRHRQLLDALLTRDPETAAEAMQHHIEDLGVPPVVVSGSSELPADRKLDSAT
jgi:DNA-binding GntR family transcriptional regulator